MSNEASTENSGFMVVEESAVLIYLIDGVDHEGLKKFGIPKAEITKLVDRGSNIKLAQFSEIVIPGMVLAKHVFQGLKRPLCDGEDMNADRSKLAICLQPGFDYCWNEQDRFDARKIVFREAPDGKVFVVIVSPNARKDKYPSADYWIERWFWVRRSNTLLTAPVDFDSRYDRQLK